MKNEKSKLYKLKKKLLEIEINNNELEHNYNEKNIIYIQHEETMKNLKKLYDNTYKKVESDEEQLKLLHMKFENIKIEIKNFEKKVDYAKHEMEDLEYRFTIY